MSTQKSKSAPGEVKRTSRRDKSCGSQGGGTGHASVGTSIHSSNNQCTETSATFVASKVTACQTEHIVTRSASLTHTAATKQSQCKETRGGSMKSQVHGYQSVLAEARSNSIKNKTRVPKSEHSRTRSGSIKNKSRACQSEHSRTINGSIENKTHAHQIEHSQTRSGSRKSKTCRKSIDFQIEAIETEVHPNKNKKGAISLSPDQGKIIKDTPTKRKHRSSEGGSNCTSMRGNKAAKPGSGSLANKDSSRAGSVVDESPQLQEEEIMDEESSPSNRCQSKRRHHSYKTQHHSYKTRHSDCMAASTPKQFIDKVEIVDLGQQADSLRDGRHGQNVKREARLCSEKTSSIAALRTSMVDSFQRGTLNRPKAAEINRLEVNQGHKCATGADALEEGEILSDSDVTGNKSTNGVLPPSSSDKSTTEMLPLSGSDMSISSEDSSPEDAVPVIEHTERHMFAAAGAAAVPPGSNLDPRAAVFIPRSFTSSALGLAPQPHKTDTSGIPKMSAHAYNQCVQPNAYNQSWPPFTAESHFTKHQSQLWPRHQALAHFPQTRGLDSHPAHGHIPGSDAHSFSAPLGGIFSSLSSIWSYIAVLLQRQSQLGTGPSLGPTRPGLPGSSMWAAGSTAISTELTGQTSVRRIQLCPVAGDTCPGK